jgi:hypothetical protein
VNIVRTAALAVMLTVGAANAVDAPAAAPVTAVPAPPAASAPAVPPVRVNDTIVLPAGLSPEARAENHLLANAAALNDANQALLTRNQQLAMANESLSLQLRVMRDEQQAEAMGYGALAALGGVLLGWLLAGLRRSGGSSW